MFTSLYIVYIFTSLYISLHVCKLNGGFPLASVRLSSVFSCKSYCEGRSTIGCGVEEVRCKPVGEKLLRSLTDKTNAMHFCLRRLHSRRFGRGWGWGVGGGGGGGAHLLSHGGAFLLQVSAAYA